MSSAMPKLGSKISLISKADIRYEGCLYTVDPQECTIALSNVRSFGTEDRETQFKIAPQSQIYDYILFRGSDIKDIRVENNNLPQPNDPAIMQMQLPNGQQVSPHYPMSAAAPNYEEPLATMPGIGVGLNANMQSAVSTFAQNSNVAPPYVQQPMQQQQYHNALLEHQNQPTMPHVSRSASPVSIKSHTSPAKALTQTSLQKVGEQIQQGDRAEEVEQNLENNEHAVGFKKTHQLGSLAHPQINLRTDGNSDLTQQHRNRRETARNSDTFQRNQVGNNATNAPNRNMWNAHRGAQANQSFKQYRTSGNFVGNARYRNPQQNYRRMVNPNLNQNKQRNGKATIKFDEDYDFEQANHKFEELRLQLTNLKVEDESKSTEQTDNVIEKKDDLGNDAAAVEQQSEEVTVCYDKTKSFFDNISCEAAQDRNKNKKVDWRQERKLNTKTFGTSSARRGGFRAQAANFFNRNAAPLNGNAGNGYIRNYRGNSYRNYCNYQNK